MAHSQIGLLSGGGPPTNWNKPYTAGLGAELSCEVTFTSADSTCDWIDVRGLYPVLVNVVLSAGGTVNYDLQASNSSAAVSDTLVTGGTTGQQLEFSGASWIRPVVNGLTGTVTFRISGRTG